jgi:hypothetical protein
MMPVLRQDAGNHRCIWVKGLAAGDNPARALQSTHCGKRVHKGHATGSKVESPRGENMVE